ncbi:MAG TPA: hypothetical protein VJT49_00270 [Amycolatopsis sp.]|uniref:hypothetical protein n=1 Tax=Amycolatopsis sp. TaxID=37632 RepID=UPI002B45C952|nr:hypothetical protein [Amycolatopsis sp.]HKS43549.1 hypothetical protein [Amycolatopsis sp.]
MFKWVGQEPAVVSAGVVEPDVLLAGTLRAVTPSRPAPGLPSASNAAACSMVPDSIDINGGRE